jgi:hypothetical protein
MRLWLMPVGWFSPLARSSRSSAHSLRNKKGGSQDAAALNFCRNP